MTPPRTNPPHVPRGILAWAKRSASVALDVTLTAAVLIGIPALLWWWGGWPPWPTTLPTTDELLKWTSALPRLPAEARYFGARIIACAVWLLWLLIVIRAASITLVAAARLGRRLARRPRPAMPRLLPGGPTQVIAGGMVGAVAVGLTTATTPPGPDIALAAVPPTPDTDTTPTTPQPPAPAVVPPAVTAEPVSAVGLSLPDGSWLDGHLTDTLTAAVTARWIHRRRLYRPGTITTTRTDPDLAPVPPPIAAILRAAAPTPPGEDPSESRDTTPSPVLTPPPGMLCWTGPGADAALRAAVAATLLTPTGGTVWCTTTTWERLFGTAAHSGLARLRLAVDAARLLDDYEQHLLNRIPEPAASTRTLVLIEPPSSTDLPRWRFAAAVAAHLHTTTLMLGPAPDEETPTWHIDTDGTTTGGRLSVLTPPTGHATVALAHDPTTSPEPRSPAKETATGNSAHSMADNGSRPALRLRVLGDTVLYDRHGGMTEIPIQRRAAVEVLVLLAVHKHGLTTGELLAAMWPDVRTHSAYRRLQTTLSSLRTALRPYAADALDRTGDRYRLHPTHLDVDLWTYEHLRSRAATAADTEQRQEALRALTDLYADELAAGADWPWLTPHREATRRTTIDAYLHLADAATDHGATLDLLRQALDVDPLNESVHRRIMKHHADGADLDAAAHTYRHLTQQLAAYGIAPDDETVRLAEHLLTTRSPNP
ncbi:AfsR/SARP family transcriptional regulator [Virgisporangium aliadipatigenens]|uniref:AfsR/SARP family transcriptional regulator n=1 Tax=Virgisporangium aliadipatigenens TaxID=741659 RepID=UPI00194418C0|nr:bacterial transcriptional activator domain-containing protein [Virgisporangium aliadipatigenens]